MPHLVVADPRPHKPGVHNKHPHEHPQKPHHHKNHKHSPSPKKHEKHEKHENGKGEPLTSHEPVKPQEIKFVKTAMFKKVVLAEKTKSPSEKTKAPSVLLCNIPMLVGFNSCCGDSCTAATTLARADSDQSTLSDDNKSHEEKGEPVNKAKEVPLGTWENFFTDFNDFICGKRLIGGTPPTIDIATPVSNGSSMAQAAENAQKEDKEEILATRSLMDNDSVEALAEGKAEALKLESEENVTTVNETIVVYFSGSDARPEDDKTGVESVEASEGEEENECAQGSKVMVILDPVAEDGEVVHTSDSQKDGCMTPCLSAVEGEGTNAPLSQSVRFQLMAKGSFNEMASSSQAESAPAQKVEEAEVPKEITSGDDDTDNEKAKESANEDPVPAPQAVEKIESTPEPEAVEPPVEVEPESQTKEAELVSEAEVVAPAILSEEAEHAQIEDPSPVIDTAEEKKEDIPSDDAPTNDIDEEGEAKPVAIIKSDKLVALKSTPTDAKGMKMTSLLSGGF